MFRMNTSKATTTDTATTIPKEKYFRTTKRDLEQFLWMHKVRFAAQMKMEDGINAWIYEKTPKFMRVLEEYNDLKDEPFTR